MSSVVDTKIIQDIEVCKSIVEDELLALESIFPDCLVRSTVSSSKDDPNAGITIKLELPISLVEDMTAYVVNDGTITQSANAGPSASKPAASTQSLHLSHLPPLILDICLPPSYPLHHSPIFLSSFATYSWLSPHLLIQLERSFLNIWAEQQQIGEGSLWRIVELVTSGECLSSPLHLIDTTTRVLTIPHATPILLLPFFKSYNASMLASSFSTTTFDCAICLSPRKGAACIQLSSCGHVFCRDCLKDYWGLAVKEGDCGQVRCADGECVAKAAKRRKTAAPTQNSDENADEELDDTDEASEEDVRRVLDEDEVKRWKWLREKRDLERDPTVVHCPLQMCQSPVPGPKLRTKKEDDDEYGANGAYSTGWEKLRTCNTCGFSFCVFCKKTWHGPITPCSTPSTTAFLLEYLALPEDSTKRLRMEKTLGRENVKRMIRRFEEEEKNQAWMKESTTACPGCGVRCQKSFGCNHMTCARCNAHYCYRCGQSLVPSEPYVHFSARGTSCYNRLFDEDGGTGDEWLPMEGFVDD